MDVLTFSFGSMLIIAIAVLSGVDETVVTTFDAQTGHQLGQSAKFAGAPLDIEILSPDWPDDNTRDIVTLSSNGFIRRFHHHELAWEATSTEYPPSRQCPNLKCERRTQVHCDFVVQDLCRVYSSTWEIYEYCCGNSRCCIGDNDQYPST